MGANIRLREWKIERRLRRNATMGMRRAGDPVAEAGASDRRRQIPPLGLREYWYPAMPVRKIRRGKPLFWTMLGDEMVVFRDDQGNVSVLSDVCPHRGAPLSRGSSFYDGTVACPYHGAVFDGSGRCRAFLTEGPDSRMPEFLRVKSYAAIVLKGWLFIWMGNTDPVDPKEDIPPEFFEGKSSHICSSYTYWPTPWVVSLENQNDAHNCLYVHRNSLMQLTADRGRKRTPVGPRSKLVGESTLVAMAQNQQHYADDQGRVPFQMYYAGVGGNWPRGKWRRRLWQLFSPWYRHVVFAKWRIRLAHGAFPADEEWGSSTPGSSCWRLPSGIRINSGIWMFTRYAVPIDANSCRMVYYHTRIIRTAAMRIVMRAWWRVYFNYWNNYNFSGQDARVASPCRYWTEETLAPTDAHLILLRKLITERSRDIGRGQSGVGVEEGTKVTRAEESAYAGARLLGEEVEQDLSAAEQSDVIKGDVDLFGGFWRATP